MTKKRTRRTHSAEVKARIALLALRGDLTVAEIAQRNQIPPEPGHAVEDAAGGARGGGLRSGIGGAGSVAGGYNDFRPHQSLENRTPDAVYFAALAQAQRKAA